MTLLSVSSKIVLNYSVTQLLSFILTVCFFYKKYTFSL